MAPEIRIALHMGRDALSKYMLRRKRSGDVAIAVPCHADELPLSFDIHRTIEVTKRSRDYRMTKLLVKAWTYFAKLKYENT